MGQGRGEGGFRDERMPSGRMIRRGRLALVALAAALALACDEDSTGPDGNGAPADTVALPDTLFDGNGYPWEIQTNGSIVSGSLDSYDGGLALLVDATGFGAFGQAIAHQSGREYEIGPDTLDGLEVTRRVYVPGDRAFARYLEVFVNRGAAAVATTVVVSTNLGSDAGGTVTVATSDGDATYEAADLWLVTDDASDGGVDPTLAHVVAGPGASIAVASVTLASGVVTQTFTIDVAAGRRLILMHFASQNFNRDAASRSATALGALGVVGALAGMGSADLADVANWDLTP